MDTSINVTRSCGCITDFFLIARSSKRVEREKEKYIYIYRERKRESLCLGFHAPAFSTARWISSAPAATTSLADW